MSKAKPPIKVARRLPRPTTQERHHPIINDFYHWLLSLKLLPFLAAVLSFYLLLNTLFALIYSFTGGGIANAKSFADIFFFSIQTLSTVGYGAMYPQNFAAQVTVGLEVFIGLFLIALLTGLMYARFSRPTAKVVFSKVAVVSPFDGIQTLMFRVANRRENQILEAKVQVSLLRFETTKEGYRLRRFYDLKLPRERTPAFGLSWLVMHPIDQNSPFYGATLESIETAETEIWITLTGLDETSSQTIHARCYYKYSEILWDMRFVDLFSQDERGQYYMNIQLIHDVVPV